MMQNKIRPFYLANEVLRYLTPLRRIFLIQEILDRIEIALAPCTLTWIIHVYPLIIIINTIPLILINKAFCYGRKRTVMNVVTSQGPL